MKLGIGALHAWPSALCFLDVCVSCMIAPHCCCCCWATGWDLAQSLLRPRSIEVDDDGRVSFVSQGGFQRIGAQVGMPGQEGGSDRTRRTGRTGMPAVHEKGQQKGCHSEEKGDTARQPCWTPALLAHLVNEVQAHETCTSRHPALCVLLNVRVPLLSFGPTQEALRHRFLRPAALHERNLRRSLGSVSADQTATAEESLDEPLSSGSGSRSRAGSGGRRGSVAARSNGRGGSGSESSGASTAASSRSGSGSSRAGSAWWGLGRKKQQLVEEEEEEEVEAAAPAAAAASSNGGLFTAAAGLWRGMQDRLFDLEARMIKTASETAKQTTKVQKLEVKVRLLQGCAVLSLTTATCALLWDLESRAWGTLHQAGSRAWGTLHQAGSLWSM